MSAAPASLRAGNLTLVRTREADDLASPPGLDEVEDLMRELASTSRSTLAREMTHEHLATGGKRLRARLALAATAALGGAHGDGVVWAAAVELLHNATLIHDDIQDEDLVRRGRPTVWARRGTAQAINAGDLMLMLPYLAVSQLPPEVSGELTRAIAEHAVVTVSGQIDELALPQLLDPSAPAPSWQCYLDAVSGKTGALLALPIYGATLLAGRSMGQAASFAAAFAELGVLFQLQDDVVDLYGDKGRHLVGCDLYEGKISALVVAHLERRPWDRTWLTELLMAPREQTPATEVRRAIQRFRDSGALASVLARIDAIAERTHQDPTLANVPRLHAVARHLAALATRPIQHVSR